MEGPFHAGELHVQTLTGERARAQRTGRIITRSVPVGAFEFIARQSMAVLGSLDARGRPRASLVAGAPGFVRAQDPETIVLDRARMRTAAGDPLWDDVRADGRVGMLLIDLDTRRRLRINGRARGDAGGDVVIAVEQAFPNCPKYIQRRRARRVTTSLPAPGGPTRGGPDLSPAQRIRIGRADTFFIASVHPHGGVDISHRGGAPGFVRLLDTTTLRIPDYAGNGMFNTLGNLAVEPRAGLLFPDFDGSGMLQLAGRAELILDGSDAEGLTGGTNRFWDFHVEETLELGALPLRFTLLETSPFNPEPPTTT